ncbi:MAG TPA: rRNA maturation RNase YbeY, partial [Elusimicrobia bacterium]|nr:rRNA maturation RNase YbeY [Elusimicrobiota bacterium]
MPIELFFKTATPVGVKRAAKLFKKAVSKALGPKLSKRGICLIFTGNSEIKKLNNKFLGRNRVTDVIAFNYPPQPGLKFEPVLGDIYVCLPQAAGQARDMGHSLLTELLILSVHGALHLAGMDDATPALRRRMNLKTTAILNLKSPVD